MPCTTSVHSCSGILRVQHLPGIRKPGIWRFLPFPDMEVRLAAGSPFRFVLLKVTSILRARQALPIVVIVVVVSSKPLGSVRSDLST